MKANKQVAARFIAKPDLTRAGVLLYGMDAMRVALKRQDLVKTVIGPDGEADMRLTRIEAADLRKDPSMVTDALKAVGFFPGDRVVLVENAGDGLKDVLGNALQDWAEGDALLVVTAGQLNARSGLRKAFEAAPNALAIGVYDDPPGRDEIEAELARAGVSNVSPDAMADITALTTSLDPGDFRQVLTKLSLYKLGDQTPVSTDDVLAIAPLVQDTAVDEVVGAAADGRPEALGLLLSQMAGQGVNATTLCIAATRHFRQLFAASTDPSGPEGSLSRARPPVFGPRRDRMIRQVHALGPHQLEGIVTSLTDTDLTLRSSKPVPALAMLERALIRIAMLKRRQ